MLRLKDRNRSVPNGYTFYLPEIKWRAPGNFPSFRVVSDALEAVIKANPFLAKKHQWPTDRTAIEDWVDLYNATVCAKMGWDEFITTGLGGSSLPKSEPPPQSRANLAAAAVRVKELMAGAKSLLEWDDSGEPAVSFQQANNRAITCVACPLNTPGDWTQWFTIPSAELIQRRVEKAHGRGLTTHMDDQLHLCAACHCPLKVKVHVPINWIRKRLTQEQVTRLDPKCWILSETR